MCWSEYKILWADLKTFTERKVSKYGVISGPFFPVFGLNTGKYRPEITPYLDTFSAIIQRIILKSSYFWKKLQQVGTFF